MYDTILVPTDGSEAAAPAERRALDLADRHGASVHGLFVVDPRGTPLSSELSASEVEDLFLEEEDHPGESLRARAADRDVPAVAETRVGRTAEEIVDYADEAGADLIVMGTHGRSGLERYLLGSTTERTLRRADAPVLCIQGTD